MHRDGKKENPASTRCLTLLLQCLRDSSTVPLRLMTAALGFNPVELRMLTNAHYGASTIQTGSATTSSSCVSPSYTFTIMATICQDSSRFEQDGKIGVQRGAAGCKKRKSNIYTVSHDAPTVSARFIYGYPTIHDGSATIYHGGATNAHGASTIRYGARTIQAGSATTFSSYCIRDESMIPQCTPIYPERPRIHLRCHYSVNKVYLLTLLT